MNAERQTGFGKLTSSELFVHRPVLVYIILNKSDRRRNQSGEKNDREQNKQKRGTLASAPEICRHYVLLNISLRPCLSDRPSKNTAFQVIPSGKFESEFHQVGLIAVSGQSDDHLSVRAS